MPPTADSGQFLCAGINLADQTQSTAQINNTLLTTSKSDYCHDGYLEYHTGTGHISQATSRMWRAELRALNSYARAFELSLRTVRAHTHVQASRTLSTYSIVRESLNRAKEEGMVPKSLLECKSLRSGRMYAHTEKFRTQSEVSQILARYIIHVVGTVDQRVIHVRASKSRERCCTNI